MSALRTICLLIVLLLSPSLCVASALANTEAAAEPAAAPDVSTAPAKQAFPTAITSPPKTGQAIAARPTSMTSPWLVLMALAAIVALIYGCAWLMRRLGGGYVGAGRGMRILTGMNVGPREKVLLIEVGERQLLIGVASGNVSLLERFDEPPLAATTSGDEPLSGRFKSLLAAKRRETAS